MSLRYISSDPKRFSQIGGREEQQDYCDYLILENSPYGCWVMADGLGGHAGGALASRLAVDKVLEAFATNPEVSKDALRRYIDLAQEAVILQQESNPRFLSMRTTIVVLLLSSEKAVWGHVGDSRLYHFRHNRIVAVTKDHSVSQALVDAGKINDNDLRKDPNRNKLTRCLGSRENYDPNIGESLGLGVEDRFLLCTDGFWERIWEEEIEADLQMAPAPDQWLKGLEDRLLSRVTGKFDNYSALAVYIA